MDINLKGKTALISGSTSGIGRAIAIELAGLGAHCVLLARNEAKVKETLATLDTSAGQEHHYLMADFNNAEEVNQVVTDFVKENPIHVLINNTGGPPAGNIVDASVDAFLKAYQQHLVCNHYLAQAVIPSMKSENYGRIINIISTSVKIPLNGLGVSNTTRGAVASWAKTLSNELAAFGITVNNVLPGATKTERLADLVQNKANKLGKEIADVESGMIQQIPMGRFGEPKEIAAVAAFLACPAASYLTGVSIQVDGGRTGTIV